MNKKNLKLSGLLIIFFLMGICLAGCNGKTKEETVKKESNSSCFIGTEKNVVGRRYTIIGVEKYTIQGKTYDLCCWQVGEGKNQKKICNDRTDSPIGYDHGILFESSQETGQLYKSMETYREGTKACQKFFKPDGTLGSLNCKDRLN